MNECFELKRNQFFKMQSLIIIIIPDKLPLLEDLSLSKHNVVKKIKISTVIYSHLQSLRKKNQGKAVR